MATEVQKGAQTAVIDTEHTLTTQTSVGTYVLWVDTANMVAGDVLELRAYVKVKSDASNYRLVELVTLENAQSRPALVSIPYLVAAVQFTLTQTDGTGRSYDWGVFSP